MNVLLDMVQPNFTLLFRTGNNDIEHPAMKIGDAAETEDAILPDGFQRIAKDFFFSSGFRI